MSNEASAVTPGQAAYEAYVMAAPGDLNFREPDKLDDWEYPAWEAAAQAGYEQRAGEDLAARQPQPAPGVPEGCDPRLLDGLRKFGDEWGPLGVAIAAASLTSRDALIAATDPGAVRKPADDVKPAPELAAAMAALAGELEAEAFRLAPPGAPEDPPDMADYIRAEALSVAASRIRDRAGVPS